MTAVGHAETEVAPDQAVLLLTVQAKGSSAAEAAKLAAARSASVLQALRSKLGAADRAETAGTSLQPVYAYEKGKPPRITGYAAQHQLRAVTGRIDQVGAILDATTSAADVLVDSVRFELADPAPAQAAALRLAARDARMRASAMAEGLGAALGPLRAIREVGGPPPRPMGEMRMQAAAADAAPPTELIPPQLRITGDVEVSFELAPGSRS